MFLIVFKEFNEVKFRHPEDEAAHEEWVDEVALHACDVRYGEMGDRAVFEGWLSCCFAGTQLFPPHRAGDIAFRDDIRV